MTFYLAHNRGYGTEMFLERRWSQQLFGCESCVPQHQNLVHHKTVFHYSHSVHTVSHLNSTVAPCRIYNKGYYSTHWQCDTIWSGRHGETCCPYLHVGRRSRFLWNTRTHLNNYMTTSPNTLTAWNLNYNGLHSLCNQMLTAQAVFMREINQHKHNQYFS